MYGPHGGARSGADPACWGCVRAVHRGSARQAGAVGSDRVLARLDSFIAAYGARATLFELWAGKPKRCGELAAAFRPVGFLAELAIRVPDLDELEEAAGCGGRAARTLRIYAMASRIRTALDSPVSSGRVHAAGASGILGLADFEHNLSELTALAGACLQYALEVAMRENRLVGAAGRHRAGQAGGGD